MKKYFWLTIKLFFLVQIVSGQSVDISILDFKDQYKDAEPEWYNCDSAFYKSDTVIFTTLGYSCSCFGMTIRKKNIGKIHELNACVEPPISTIRTDIIKGKIKKHSGQYSIYIYKSNEVWKAFKILELTKKSYFDKNNFQREYYYMRLVKT